MWIIFWIFVALLVLMLAIEAINYSGGSDGDNGGFNTWFF